MKISDSNQTLNQKQKLFFVVVDMQSAHWLHWRRWKWVQKCLKTLMLVIRFKADKDEFRRQETEKSKDGKNKETK